MESILPPPFGPWYRNELAGTYSDPGSRRVWNTVGDGPRLEP